MSYLTHIAMLPAYMQEGVLRWIENGSIPGGFLCAVLENNLFEAFTKADLTNRAAMGAYVEFFFNHAPEDCWGSPEKVRAWAEHEGLKGQPSEADYPQRSCPEDCIDKGEE